ncbi:MAG: KpsF/GutQ family sugar-phosphate isomerase [Ginsengibacter sp.]
MTNQQIIDIAKRTVDQQSTAIRDLLPLIGNGFAEAIHEINNCKGRVVISGIGKSAIVGQKIVATLNSTGTPSLFMHTADAIHGDIGMVQQGDVVIIVSKSGEGPEIKVLIPLIKNFGNTIIAMVGQAGSFLATNADIILDTTVSGEACPNNLAPTTSTTAQMVLGDALAICLMEVKGFGPGDFAKFHPGGMLGKKLYLRVGDLYPQNEKPVVKENDGLKEVIIEITKKRLGATVVLGEGDKISGIITDGDLRRMLERNLSLNGLVAKDIMTADPKCLSGDDLAVDALDLMRKKNISQLVVSENSMYKGIIHIHDLIREGII